RVPEMCMTTDLIPRVPPPGRTRRWRRSAMITSIVLALVAGAVAFAGASAAAPTLISQGKPVTASSVENAAFPASNAVDGDPGTRWSSAFSDPQWIRIDLGDQATKIGRAHV